MLNLKILASVDVRGILEFLVPSSTQLPLLPGTSETKTEIRATGIPVTALI